MRRISSGGRWEASIGYSRAVAFGDTVLTAGCTSTVDGTVRHPGDPYEQALVAFGIGLDALAEAGARLDQVVRTRMYVVDIARNGDAVGRAHGDLFREQRPAATMVGVAALIDPDQLVEVELEAWLG